MSNEELTIGESALEERRTAAIAFADIVGYSILMSTEGEQTHARWMTLLNGTLKPLARRHGSTLVKSTGDGVVASFPTVGDAFAWAREVQHATLSSDLPTLPPIAFRIAIHYGEMLQTPEDIYGAAVNAAARLQEHAPPGGILLTRAALSEIPNPPALRDLGAIALRNIVGSIHAFAWDPPEPARVPIRPLLSGVPSLAVLPLENVGRDPADLYFAVGIMEDVVISLGSLPELSVLARSATLGWPSGRYDPRVVGRMLGVRYILSGSVRRCGGGLRILVELRETEEGDSIWNDKIEAADTELFDAQDGIVARVVAGIAPSVRAAELRRALRRRPDSLTAYDLTLKGMYSLDGLQRETFAEARTHLEKAIREDPGFSMPVAWSAQWHSLAVGQAWSDAPHEDASLAGSLASRAIQLDPRNALGFAIAGHHRAYHLRDPGSALPFFEKALATCPSHALSWTLRSGSLSYLGRGEEAIASARRGFNLSPFGPHRYYFQFFVGLAYYAAGDEAEAVHWLKLSLQDSPCFTSAHRILMAALVAVDKIEEARAVARQMMACEPVFRISKYKLDRAPFVDPSLREQLFSRMKTAGVPE
jgi:class 3 adenylate cyclase/TolB-like protein